MFTVLLFYKYVPIHNTQELINHQTLLCESNNLLGRVIVSPEGINATLCGTQEACNVYIQTMRKNILFTDIDFKINYSPFPCFTKLKIKFRPEIVMFHNHHLAKPAASNILEYYISAEELHTTLLQENHSLFLVDIRNQYESRIGHFTNAFIPPISNSREFHEYFITNKELFRDKDVVMYCSGGVRCERTSTALRALNACKSIRHLKNGIHGYIEKYPNGFFKGRYYVFDDRISIQVTQDILTHCDICFTSCDIYNNCLNALCNKHYISCDSCLHKTRGCCSKECEILTQKLAVPLRPPLPSRNYPTISVNYCPSSSCCYL